MPDQIKLKAVLLDCTLRDGGYYNDWDFSIDLVHSYLNAMQAISVDYVELGFRSLKNSGFKGAYAYTTDSHINSLSIPDGLKLGVMINAAEFIEYSDDPSAALNLMFTAAESSLVSLVRIAARYKELELALYLTHLLKEMGYTVAINLMQATEFSDGDLQQVSKQVSESRPDIFYVADSMGRLQPNEVKRLVQNLKTFWDGAIGIHAHDNLGGALSCTKEAYSCGVTWLDSTVLGMGRGAGNTPTEYLIVEFAEERKLELGSLSPLVELIQAYFTPLRNKYAWGTNPFYYIAGKYGVHPTFIQKMIADQRYSSEDMIAVIQHLNHVGGTVFSVSMLESGRNYYNNQPAGTWKPSSLLEGRDVLLLGAGPSIKKHAKAIEQYIQNKNLFVMALNTVDEIRHDLIDVRVACHPVRLLADCEHYAAFSQPLIAPVSMLPDDIRQRLTGVELLDYGMKIEPNKYELKDAYCVVPVPLVVSYALAITAKGGAQQVLLAGFDGYSSDDPRRAEVDILLREIGQAFNIDVVSITPTKYELKEKSAYAV